MGDAGGTRRTRARAHVHVADVGGDASSRISAGNRLADLPVIKPRRSTCLAEAERRRMRIAIDARELHGKPTGVGRFLGELLAAWKTMPDAQVHDFINMTPEGADRGTLWEQFDLPRLVRRADADVLFSPGYTGPLRPPVPMVVAIHDVSFAAHPEWFSWREGARRRTITRFAARAATRVITISEFSKREIVAHLGVEDSKVAVVYPGIADLSVITPRRSSNDLSDAARTLRVRGTVLFVGSIFNRRHVPELIEGFARLA